MKLTKVYKHQQALYELHPIIEGVAAHCNQYMDSITGFIFHESEIEYQLNLMLKATKNNLAYSVVKDGQEVGFIYSIPIGQRSITLVALHFTSDIVKAILMNHLYSHDKLMRFMPRDPICRKIQEFLLPVSLKMYLASRTSTINMLTNVDTTIKLKEYQIEEL